MNFSPIDIEPTVENVRDAYNRKHKKQADTATPSQKILDHWDNFIKFQINIQKIAKGTVNQYASAKKHLLEFEIINKVKLTYVYLNYIPGCCQKSLTPNLEFTFITRAELIESQENQEPCARSLPSHTFPLTSHSS